MKKLLLTLAILAGFTLHAATIAPAVTATEIVKQEKKYKKIEVTDVSKVVLDKIKKNYGDYSINEAHVAEDGEYKLVLTRETTTITATFTAAGDLIKILN